MRPAVDDFGRLPSNGSHLDEAPVDQRVAAATRRHLAAVAGVSDLGLLDDVPLHRSDHGDEALAAVVGDSDDFDGSVFDPALVSIDEAGHTRSVLHQLVVAGARDHES